jgi:hypothetical protein
MQNIPRALEKMKNIFSPKRNTQSKEKNDDVNLKVEQAYTPIEKIRYAEQLDNFLLTLKTNLGLLKTSSDYEFKEVITAAFPKSPNFVLQLMNIINLYEKERLFVGFNQNDKISVGTKNHGIQIVANSILTFDYNQFLSQCNVAKKTMTPQYIHYVSVPANSNAGQTKRLLDSPFSDDSNKKSQYIQPQSKPRADQIQRLNALLNSDNNWDNTTNANLNTLNNSETTPELTEKRRQLEEALQNSKTGSNVPRERLERSYKAKPNTEIPSLENYTLQQNIQNKMDSANRYIKRLAEGSVDKFKSLRQAFSTKLEELKPNKPNKKIEYIPAINQVPKQKSRNLIRSRMNEAMRDTKFTISQQLDKVERNQKLVNGLTSLLFLVGAALPVTSLIQEVGNFTNQNEPSVALSEGQNTAQRNQFTKADMEQNQAYPLKVNSEGKISLQDHVEFITEYFGKKGEAITPNIDPITLKTSFSLTPTQIDLLYRDGILTRDNTETVTLRYIK